MFLLKLLLAVVLFKLLWVVLAGLVFVLFWGAVLGIIAGRSVRDKLNGRPRDLHLPR